MTQGSYRFSALFGLTLASVVFIIAACLLIVHVVDPYGLHIGFPLRDETLKRPEIYRYGVAAKEAKLSRLTPNVLLVGNSRVDAGFDPKSALWPAELRPVFNFGVPGAGLRALEPAIQRQLDDRKPTLWIGVDFFDFIRVCPAQHTQRPTRVAVSQTMLWAEQHLSLDALIDSGATVLAQGRQAVVSMTELGLNPWYHIQSNYKIEGPYAVFQQRNIDYYKRFATFDKTLRCNDMPHQGWDDLKRILDAAKASEASVVLFTHPFHGDLLHGIDHYGFWPVLEDFKRTLLSVSEAYDTDVYDFTTVSGEALEAVPSRTVRSDTMAYYYEGGHYRPALGDKMISALVGRSSDFGVKLTQSIIEGHLKDERRKWSEAVVNDADRRRRAEAVAKTARR